MARQTIRQWLEENENKYPDTQQLLNACIIEKKTTIATASSKLSLLRKKRKEESCDDSFDDEGSGMPSSCVITVNELFSQYDIPTLIMKGIKSIPQKDGHKGLMIEGLFLRHLVKVGEGKVSQDKFKRILYELPELEKYRSRTPDNRNTYWGDVDTVKKFTEKVNRWH